LIFRQVVFIFEDYITSRNKLLFVWIKSYF